MIKIIFASLFLVCEAAVLLMMLRVGIFDLFTLVLILLIVLNVVKLRSMLTPKEKKAVPPRTPSPAVPVPEIPDPEITLAELPVPEFPRSEIPDREIPLAELPVPEFPRSEIPLSKEDSQDKLVRKELEGFAEMPLEEYRAKAQKIMEADPDSTMRFCWKCGNAFPIILPRCPHCGHMLGK